MTRGYKTGGRQKGTLNRTTVERRLRVEQYAGQAAADGPLPLDVMLQAMRQAHAAGDMPAAAQFAAMAAPYVHQRLQAIDTHVVSDNVHRVFSDQPISTTEWCLKYNVQADKDAVVLEGEAIAVEDRRGAAD